MGIRRVASPQSSGGGGEDQSNANGTGRGGGGRGEERRGGREAARPRPEIVEGIING
jgi:hypothetical protein